ncbi:hypothetical protein FSP39_004249 [Pinctada imbricata]|uniref:DNA-directed DNA polymerase n=1 Tax=Pinctada imbricata TaxID=66713 RepID=A0AA88YUU5_PINIB|nr:hypothetical protein FSP39_004249 [Pinctada imbricata]
MVSKRFNKTNNKNVSDFDHTLPAKYIMYYDANNLYGGVMRMPLPVGMFRWLSKEELSNFSLNSVRADSDIGYTLEVDLDYPDELHDNHNCFPLAPHHKEVLKEELSPYNADLLTKINGEKKNSPRIQNLIPTLENKKNYVVHYRTLQLYLALSLKCTKIHKILEYKLEPWLRKYIDFNSEKKKKCQIKI